MINFYFFHVGSDVSLPEMLVGSIKISNPKSKIYQITDNDSPYRAIRWMLSFQWK